MAVVEVPVPAVPPREGASVLAVGASAGGLDPLIALLRACPAGQGLAVLVVQHLAPQQASSLAALLQPHTAFQVRDAVDGVPLQADHVHVITPGTLLTVQAGCLRVQAQPQHAVPAAQIDALFRSLALDCPDRAAGVVLSGLGCDGSEGLRALLARGGGAFAQRPEDAAFDAMPRSAAALSPAVQVLAAAEIPPAFLRVRGQAVLAAAAPADLDTLLSRVLARLAAHSGHDFSLYKVNTLLRRIERRMAIHGLTSMVEYERLLAGSSQEASLLFKEMLIGVTSFFRDPALWQHLADQVLPDLVAEYQARAVGPLRVWVVACSTGEEAYTLAMLLREALEQAQAWQPGAVQIFATDLSPDAIDTARRGLYPAAAVQPLTTERLQRFFRAEEGGWRVSKELREMLLFARHDLTSDAPFSRLDLVSCRNLLIYFNARLQQRVLPLLHYVLRPGGLLLLGGSETVGAFETLFPPLDARLRIYRRGLAPLSHASAAFPTRSATMPVIPADPSLLAASAGSLQAMADRLMLDQFAPPAVLVDAEGDILYVSGRTGRFLEPAAGKANWNVHAMAREGLRGPLTLALRECLASGQRSERRGLLLQADGVSLDLQVRPVSLPGHGPLALLVFMDCQPMLPAAGARKGRRGAAEQALQAAQEELQALREEMRSSQEELQSTNEELQSTNEEMQSANEELTTSKEEMQAMNEELQTVNAELLSKLDDLSLAQSDLKNLLNSTQIATLFLDKAMNVRRFTEQAKQVISLRESDVGRPLSDLSTLLDYAALAEDVERVLRTLEFSEKAVKTSDGRWYSVRVMPYRTQENVIEGSVITFVDITAAKQLEARLRELGGAAP